MLAYEIRIEIEYTFSVRNNSIRGLRHNFMSDTDNRSSSILLPTSSVAVYSKDPNTLEVARALLEDWRFARVDLLTEEGDVQDAAVAYRDMASPDLIIVQTDNIEESLTQQLDALASCCDEGTSAIVIGPVNDVYLYRQLIEMGVSDYLVRPVEPSVLADVIAKTLIERKGMTQSRLVAFMGAKGGVGTSSLVRGAAYGASELMGQKTILLDASGGWSVMSVGMGFEPSTTLCEAARATTNQDDDSLKRMLYKENERFHVLASGGDVLMESPVTAEQMEELVNTLMITYPVVFVDLSHASAELMKTVVTRAHEIVIVSTRSLPSLRLARTLLQEIKDVRGGEEGNIEVIINMQGIDSQSEASNADIEQALDLSVSSYIPFVPKVFMGTESESRNLAQDKEGAALIKTSILPVLRKILSEDSGAVQEEQTTSAGSIFSGLFKGKAH